MAETGSTRTTPSTIESACVPRLERGRLAWLAEHEPDRIAWLRHLAEG